MFKKFKLLKCHNVVTLQEEFTMSKRQKKKAPAVEEQTAIEVIPQKEYIYEDTQCIFGIEPEYEWGEIYRLISHREAPNTGLE